LVCDDRFHYFLLQLIQKKVEIYEIKDGDFAGTSKKEWTVIDRFWSSISRYTLWGKYKSNLDNEILLEK
jgi:hypothetical protein